MTTSLHTVALYVDGACSGNPGPGGWAAVLVMTKADGTLHSKELSGHADHTTNNRMELEAILGGLTTLTKACTVTVVTDSALAIGWLTLGWKRNNPELKLLCQLIEKAVADAGHTVTYTKVMGHSGHVYNERCDALAKAACHV